MRCSRIAMLICALFAQVNCAPESVVVPVPPPPPPPPACDPVVLAVQLLQVYSMTRVGGRGIAVLGTDVVLRAEPTLSCVGSPPLTAPVWTVDASNVLRDQSDQGNGHVFVAIAPGQATITVSWGSARDSFPIEVPPAPLMGPLRLLSAGNQATCSVNEAGTTFCWGSNGNRIVDLNGDGVTGVCDGGGGCRPIPLPRSILPSLNSLDARSGHACGLSSGQAWCWGDNGALQTGHASGPPAPVTGQITFKEVSVGGMHSCGLDLQGSAFCWGSDLLGQLGDSAPGMSAREPVPVKGGFRFKTIAAGESSTCALTEEGALFCWGEVLTGAGPTDTCNQGPKTTSAPCWLVPTPLTPAFPRAETVFRSLSLGSHACALSSEGTAYCWGSGDPQLLGLNSLSSRAPVPQPVETSLVFESISSGRIHTCALTSSGEAFCWGGSAGGTDGQLGDGTMENRTRPVPVLGGLRFRSITAGIDHTCGITLDARGYCWGGNRAGQLGTGSRSGSLVPVPILGQ